MKPAFDVHVGSEAALIVVTGPLDCGAALRLSEVVDDLVGQTVRRISVDLCCATLVDAGSCAIVDLLAVRRGEGITVTGGRVARVGGRTSGPSLSPIARRRPGLRAA